MSARLRLSLVLGIAMILGLLLWLHARPEPARSQGVSKDVARPAVSPPRRSPAQALWGSLPLGFEKNRGQIDPEVRYFARGRGFDLFLTADEAVFTSTPKTEREEPRRRERTRIASAKPTVVRMQFVDAASHPEPVGVDALPGRTNYLVGRQEAWVRDVTSYREVRYPGVWKGIDVVFHGRRHVTEYDFDVAPGADVGAIEFALAGTDRLEIDAHGNLVMTVDGQPHAHRAPRVVQGGPGKPVELAGRFVLRGGNHVGFEVDGRDPARPVVIDPEVVYVSDFFGGPDNDNIFSIDVLADGSAIVGGYTLSATWPGTSGTSFQSTNPATGWFHGAGLVAKVAADGSHLEWVTFLGGSGTDNKIWKLAVDDRGFTVACGATDSTDFPTTDNAHSRVYGGDFFDAFISVINPRGSDLTYSSYFGGSGGEFFFGCDTMKDPRGPGGGHGRNLLVAAGYTTSTNYPFVNAADTVIDGDADPVVTVVDPTGGGIVYSSLLRGSGATDNAEDVSVQGSKIAIAGWTDGGVRPLVVFWHQAVEDGAGVAQLSFTNSFWSGYGNGWNQGLTKAFTLPAGPVTATYSARWGTEEFFDFLRLRVSSDGGVTWQVLDELDGFSAGFEERAVDLSAYAGRSVLLQFLFTSDGFVSDQDGNIDTNGEAIDWVEVTGHPRDEFAAGLDGWVGSDIASFFAADVSHGPTGGSDAFVAVVNPFAPAATSMRVAALGGRGLDIGYQVEWSPDGTILANGQTATVSYPTTAGAYQRTKPGFTNLFVARLSGDLSTLIASTYLGGSFGEYPNGMAVDAAGRPILTGITFGLDFPEVDPLELGAPFDVGGGERDLYFAILSPDLSTLEHGTMFGDAWWDLGGDVEVGADGAIYILGRHRTGFFEDGDTTQAFVIKVQP